MFEQIYLDHRVKISEGVRFLYLLSSRSDPPIGDARGNKGRLLLAIEIKEFNVFLLFKCEKANYSESRWPHCTSRYLTLSVVLVECCCLTGSFACSFAGMLTF